MNAKFKKIGLIILLGVSIISCDSTSDPVSPTVVPSIFDFLFVESPNVETLNSGKWNLKIENTAGSIFTGSTNLRTDDFATFASTIPSATIISKQCSAYDKISKRYVVSSGERIIVYNFNTISGSPSLEFQIPVSDVQAIEFANGRFFGIVNNHLNEYDLTATSPTSPLTSFATINLNLGQVSNLVQIGTYLGVISGGHLYVIDTTGTGSIKLDYTLPTTDVYEGLEAINSTGAPYSLFVIKRNSAGNEFQKIVLDASLTSVAVAPTTLYSLTLLPTVNDLSIKFSSAIDYTTEFYYLNSYNGIGTDANSLTVIDLTPPVGTYAPTTATYPSSHYVFGLQLKD